MANRIIKIGNASTEKTTKELYKDISFSVYHSGDRKEIVGKLTNLQAIQNSLKQIFSWIPGERILNPEFGSNLHRYLYEGITDFNVENIISEINASVQQWEPRVQVKRVINIGTTNDSDDNTVHLEIVYTVPSLSDQQYSMPYVYYRSQI